MRSLRPPAAIETFRPQYISNSVTSVAGLLKDASQSISYGTGNEYSHALAITHYSISSLTVFI